MTTLDYRNPQRHPATAVAAQVLVWLAWVCWLAPLVGGLLMLACYWAFIDSEFALAGYLILIGGTLAAAVGITFAVLVPGLTTHTTEPARTTLRRRAKIAFVGIIANFPIALVCLLVGASLTTLSYFQIRNEGETRVSNVMLRLGGQTIAVGDLEPGEKWSARRAGVDPVFVEWQAGDAKHSQQLDTYIQSGGERVIVSLDDDRLVQE